MGEFTTHVTVRYAQQCTGLVSNVSPVATITFYQSDDGSLGSGCGLTGLRSVFDGPAELE
jgi:hypothetical protein